MSKVYQLEGVTFTGGIFTSQLLARTAALISFSTYGGKRENIFREDNLTFSVETTNIKEYVLDKIEGLPALRTPI